MMESVKVRDSPIVWIVVLLFLLLLSSYFGVFVVWSAAIGASFMWGIHIVTKKRVEVLQSMKEESNTKTINVNNPKKKKIKQEF